MKIKYGEIKFFHDWLLNNLKLAGKSSRMRMKFINILIEKEKEFQGFHQNLIKEHSRLDEEGKIKILNPDENGFGEADIVDRVAFDKDYNELLLEEFVIEENETNRQMLYFLKHAIEDCPIEWFGEDALKYEAICSRFDEIYKGDEINNG